MIALLLLGCKKKAQPKSPESAKLLFPDNNSECTTGVDINATTSQVEFKWQASANTDSYKLVVTNLNTGNNQNINATSTQAKLTIAKGTPFSWVVISENAAVVKTTSSSTWNFFNSGFETTHAPFPAEIIAPEMGVTVFKDINSEVELSWKGSDVDNDIFGYDIYFSSENPPEILISSEAPGIQNTKVSVVANTIYYWKVVTEDVEGNTSDSGVFEFKTL